MRALVRRAWAVAAVTSLLARAPALGAAETSASSSELRKKAEEDFREGDFRAALAKYNAIAAVDPDPALLYNIARCHHELGELPEAYDYYTRFAIAAPAELRAKVPHLDEKIAFVAAHTALLEIRADVLGALVTIDGRIVGRTGELGPTRVHEGKLVIDASKEGHTSAHRTIEASGGTTVKVELALPAVVSTGVLQITSSAASTTVVVDDGAPALAPVSVVEIAPDRRLAGPVGRLGGAPAGQAPRGRDRGWGRAVARDADRDRRTHDHAGGVVRVLGGPSVAVGGRRGRRRRHRRRRRLRAPDRT